MLRRILLFIFVGLSVGQIKAQQSSRVTANAVSSSGTGTFYYANRNEPPRAIVFKERTVTTSSFLTNINHYFDIPAEFTFVEVESNTDNLGMKHHLLQQYYNGIALEGMGYRAHEKDGFITSVNGKAVRIVKLDTQSTVSEEQAFSLAVKYLHTKDSIYRPGKKLIVSKGFTFTPESFSIAFQFEIDVSLVERWRISINAGNGEVINKVSLVNNCFTEKERTPPLPYGTGTGLTRYYGNQTIRVLKYDNGGSVLDGLTENGGRIHTYDYHNASVLPILFGFADDVPVYDFYSSNNIFNTPYQKAAVSVQWAAEQAYEYYFKKYNRNSFDNNGGLIKCYVHVDQNFNNAFWTGKLLAFGDGSNNNPLVELDVVSHELTHGVTQNEAQLQYYYESGALNESFSDILGKAVEFNVFGDTATWQLARHYQSGGLRDLSNPNLKNQPDTWLGDLWYTGSDDSGGVHTNSGVQNFWFYLLCKGGSGVNDRQFSYAVNAIGMDAATKIAYRNLTEYLSYTSDYLDSRIGSLLATADLYGKNSATYQEVANAWNAVGVIAQPIITSLELYDITATKVKIKGNLLPRGDTVTYHFEYGTTPSFGSVSTIYKYTDKVEGILTGLQSETKYYLRLAATNENGSSYASTEFTTISLAPLVKIKQTVDVTETTAILHGQANPNSLPTSFYFEYGLTPAYGLVTPSYPIPDTTEFLNVSATVTNLQPRQTYYYRLIATNGFAAASTESANLFTAVKPVISSYTPVSAPIGTEITITGQNFNSIREKNLVSFGATHATVLSSSSTELKVKVPAGASLGPITLLDSESGLVAESVQEFVPTFSVEFKKGDLQLRVGNKEYIYQTLVSDMDGDGKPDIIARHYLGFSVFQNVNQGGDITEASFIRSTFSTGEYTPGTLSLVDFDGNGLKDIVTYYRNVLRIYPNLSAPGYIFFGAPVDLPSVSPLSGIVFSDFDIDGHIDIAGTIYVSSDSSIFTVFRNQNPRGSLSANNFEQLYSKPLSYYTYSGYSRDLNNDGKAEFVASTFNRNFVPILKNNSHPGAFEFEENNIQLSTGERFPQYISQDLNQDGWKDVTSFFPDQVISTVVRENKSTSPIITLENPVTALIGYAQSDIQPADINGDGKVDMLIGLQNKKIIFLQNKVKPLEHLSSSSFEKFEEYGIPQPSSESGTVYVRTTINDLNGDGRPEIIVVNSYTYGPHDGYQMEIWQNSPANCLDPSSTTVTVSNTNATIVLPTNTTLDQFQIDYKYASSDYWYQVSSTTMYLSSGYTYQLRVRAKCYLGFTDYYYLNFTMDCVDTNSLSVNNIAASSVSLSAYNLSSFELQYSPAGKGLWQPVSQYSNQITNLMSGTTYDLRFRGRCITNVDFKYKQFTTLCPQLATLTLSNVIYNKALVSWTSNYSGNAILEYSANNVAWNLVDDTRILFPLIPGKQYYVRGKMSCTNINSDFIYKSFTTPCPQVSSLSIDNLTPFSAKINWVDDSNTGSYTLTYYLTGDSKITTVEVNSTSFDLDGLSPGTQYTVAVAPHCIAAKVFIPANFNTICYVPFNLLTNDITYTTAELSWSDNFGGLPYSVDCSISGSSSWSTTQTSFKNVSLDRLRPGTTYEVKVHINCPSVASPYASLLFVTDLYPETVFAPNPTDDKITIYPSKNLIGNQFTILDGTGKVLTNGELLDYTFDLSIFPIGIYILRIGGEKSVKIVKY
jgi:Zn-dependent metalloprotease